MVIGRASLILAALLSAAIAQQTGSVEGRVTSSADRNGIGGALVTIGAQRIATDASGAFRIDGLAPGPHAATIEAAGFFKRSNVGFRLDSPLAPARLDIELVAESSISGRVLDGQRKPVAGVEVEITAAVRGTGTTWSVWGATTDREGHYEVNGLQPGSYLAMARPKALPPPPSNEGERRVWASTYYPSAPAREQAARLVLHGATHQSGCDIRLLALPVHAIRGIVYDEKGNVANASVALVSTDVLAQAAEVRTTAQAGAFEFPEVTAGDWRLVADFPRGADILRGDAAVVLTDADADVVIRMALPFFLRAVVEPRIPEPPTVELYPVDSPPSGAEFSDSAPDGSLRFFHVYPTRYRVLVFGTVGGYYLDSILVGDRDLLGKEAMLTEGMPPLRIVYKPDSAGVHGRVEDCGGAAILLLPEDESLWDYRFIHRAVCGPDGRFEVRGLRPGGWYALALERIDATGLDDLATLRRLAVLAARVQVEPGRFASLDLKVQLWPE